MSLPFSQVWAVDFEFTAPAGERPDPVCLVAWELRSGTKVRLWRDELRGRRLPPYSLGPDSLFVSYFASGGRCAHCGAAISARYPVVEAITAVLSAWVAWRFGFGVPGLAALAFTFALIALTFIDADTTLLVVSDHGFKSGAFRRGDPSDFHAKTGAMWHRPFGTILAWGNGVRSGARRRGCSPRSAWSRFATSRQLSSRSSTPSPSSSATTTGASLSPDGPVSAS